MGYGYLRVPPDLADNDIRCLELGVRALAETHGLRLVGIFSEFQPGHYGEFDELITELRRLGARHVVVPSLDHLSRHPYLQAFMLMRLARDADAQLLVVRGDSGHATADPARTAASRDSAAVRRGGDG